MSSPDPINAPVDTTPASGGRLIIPGLAAGQAIFHWIVQSFVVVLPEIQQAFNLSSVAVGGTLSARELATGAVKIPAGVASDAWLGTGAGCLPPVSWRAGREHWSSAS